jgi:serine protease DegQ
LNIALTLVEGGTVEHPFLGILGTTHTETLPGDIVQPAGARIVEILGERETDLVERSAFGEAGALVDDIIVAFDGNPIRTMPELAALLRYYRADQTVEVDLIRDGQPISISLTLDRRPEGV